MQLRIVLNLLRSSRIVLILAASTIFVPAEADQETTVRGTTESEIKGFKLAARSYRSDRGFQDSTVELEMILQNAKGREKRRTLVISTLENPDEALGNKTLALFKTPRDVEGTALLSHVKILETDDQWFYLPVLKRVKRISSANKSGRFAGSEFSFEDFTSNELNKFNYQWLREEPCGDLACDVVQRTPRYRDSGYSRQIIWIDQQHFQIRQIDYFNLTNTLLKTLHLNGFKNSGGYWRAGTLRMVNHQNNNSTELIYADYAFQTGLSDLDFVAGKLSRLR